MLSGNTIGCDVGDGPNTVQGNFIGTDVSGTLLRGNRFGVKPEGSRNLVGGSGAGEGNLISGNEAGVVLQGTGVSSNVVAGNFIGTDVTGTTPLGNTNYGVAIIYGGPSGNTIGGTAAGAGNVITGTSAPGGVGVAIDFGTNNSVLGNSIFGNALGIGLGGIAVANDPSDTDDGANHLQNFPEITSANIAGRNLKLEYRVDSATANSSYPLTVEFFIADGSGQGRTFIYRTTYTTPQAMDKLGFKPTVLPNVGDKLVATTTDKNGNTSEFSVPISVARNGNGN